MGQWPLPKHAAGEGRLGPKLLEVVHRQGAVEATPPVGAEGAVVQLADVAMRAKPVPLDCPHQVGQGEGDGAASKGNALGSIITPRAPHLPDRSQDGDSQAGPQLERSRVRWEARPAYWVVSQEQGSCSRQGDARQLVPRVDEPVNVIVSAYCFTIIILFPKFLFKY